VSEQQQADYTVRGIALAREEWPWAGVFMIWYLRHVGNVPVDNAAYYFRMVDVDFTPRPVYTAVQQAARQQALAEQRENPQSPPAFPGWQVAALSGGLLLDVGLLWRTARRGRRFARGR
jgi:hypothetical protein